MLVTPQCSDTLSGALTAARGCWATAERAWRRRTQYVWVQRLELRQHASSSHGRLAHQKVHGHRGVGVGSRRNPRVARPVAAGKSAEGFLDGRGAREDIAADMTAETAQAPPRGGSRSGLHVFSAE
jgi:hypothetical protein